MKLSTPCGHWVSEYRAAFAFELLPPFPFGIWNSRSCGGGDCGEGRWGDDEREFMSQRMYLYSVLLFRSEGFDEFFTVERSPGLIDADAEVLDPCQPPAETDRHFLSPSLP